MADDDDVLFAKLLELITLESDDPDLLALGLGRCYQPPSESGFGALLIGREWRPADWVRRRVAPSLIGAATGSS